MRHRRRRMWTALALVTVLLAGTGLSGCSGDGPAGEVTVLASWTGAERAAFDAVLRGFEAESGIHVDYQGHRDVSQVLQAGIERGRPPDIAVLPRLNDVQRYVNEDQLRPLDEIVEGDAGAAAQVIRLARKTEPVGPQRAYAVAVATHLKSIFWYEPGALTAAGYRQPPVTWAELVTQSRKVAAGGRVPWCLGMSSPPVSGWPGTDWIEDILLHQSGQEAYERWTRGELSWRTGPVRDAWAAWGDLLGVSSSPGTARASLFTTWADAGSGLLTAPPACYLDHQASFVLRTYRDAMPDGGGRVDFFPTPPVGPSDTSSLQEVSDDIAAMFRDTGPARDLMAYLASEPAQRIWRESSDGLFFSRRAQAGDDADPVAARVAGRLGTGTLCRDGSDLLPTAMATAFERAVLVYLQDPGRLDALLAELDAVRRSVPPTEYMDLGCEPAAPSTD
ncbi:ABC transporter substrate-binding protein [Micromonospora sp. NPDC093244]|uniref:ABC transporter substrate-binding protein n=1 Tax=Micromonospora sp. NPDC093244 TaxID=3155071 RepID=UPI00341C9B81